MHDVVIIGGGVIGLAIAREVSQRHFVLLLERGFVGEGTSWAAAGMLSPQSEADDQGSFFQFSISSFRMFPKFAEDLRKESGMDPGHEKCGLLVLASIDEELAVLRARAEWQRAAGLSAEILKPS